MITADERAEGIRCADVIDAWIDTGSLADPPMMEIGKAMLILRKAVLAIDLIYPRNPQTRD